jgi:hypothetical protein
VTSVDRDGLELELEPEPEDSRPFIDRSSDLDIDNQSGRSSQRGFEYNE